MSELRNVVARNISELRQKNGMTQLKLAQTLNYSDKAISKWERGESFPDIFMLKRIADLFSVSVDYLLSDDHSETINRDEQVVRIVRRNRIIISFLANMLVWLIATVAFVIVGIVHPDSAFPAWMVFIYALPVSAIVALVFNSIWGKRKLNYLIITIMSWSIILAFHMTYLTVLDLNLWIVFVIGIPVQIMVALWSGINNPKVKIKMEGEKIKNESSDDASDEA